MSNLLVQESSLQEAAILMMSLGVTEAVEVFKHLSPKEVQKLGETIAKTKDITREQVGNVLDRFTLVAASRSLLVSNSSEYVRTVLSQALGNDKSSLLIDRILQGGDVSGIESLKWMDALSVAELLRNEHPQIVAAILVHLDYDQAADVLNHVPDPRRNEVMLRIATMEGIQPAALKDLNEVLAQVLSGGDKALKFSLGGIKTAAEIINLMGNALETSVIEGIRHHDDELAQQIVDKMFVFDDINKLDDKSIQLVLREISSEHLIVALKGAQPLLIDRILANMSTRAAETLKEEMESKGPLRLSEVELRQKEILRLIRRMSDEGQFVIGASKEETLV